jgi:hypothetical protein
MSRYHPVIWNLSPPAVWRCPYCRATAPLTTTKGEWQAAHGACQEAAERLPFQQLVQTYITRRADPSPIPTKQ